jgi:Carbohydrate binding domain (family 11)
VDHVYSARVIPSDARTLSLFPFLSFVALSVSAGCIGVSQKKIASGGIVGGTGEDVKVCHAGSKVADDGLIDDFEDGNNQLSAEGGRNGYWWPKVDTAGSTIEPTPFAPSGEAGDGSEGAMHVFGKTTTGDPTLAWGAGFGVNLVDPQGIYDASAYAGVTFKAKVAPGSTTSVRFNIGDINTHPIGEICKTCWNHFGKNMVLTNEWKEYKIMFSEAHQQPDWGTPRPLSLTPSKLVEIDWQVGPGNSYDIWVDDLALLDCK